MSQYAEFNQTVSHIHWTARAGFYPSFFVAIILVLSQQLFFFPIPASFSYLVYYSVLILPIPTLILSGIALFISRQSFWSRGREFAILGLIMSSILCLVLAQFLLVMCCFRLHSVF